MNDCSLQDIRAIFDYPEAYCVDKDGVQDGLVLSGPPATYLPVFREFYCVEHDCTFRQWKAVLRHLGEVEQLE